MRPLSGVGWFRRHPAIQILRRTLMNKQDDNPVMNEVYATRKEISSRFGNDPKRYIEFIREMKSNASAAGLSFLAYCQMSDGVDLASPLTWRVNFFNLKSFSWKWKDAWQPSKEKWRARVRHKIICNAASSRFEKRSKFQDRRHWAGKCNRTSSLRVFVKAIRTASRKTRREDFFSINCEIVNR